MPSTENQRSISQISRMLRSIVEAETLEYFFWVGGRIDRLYKSDLGHVYFDLVDGENRIRCMLREEQAGHIRFDPRNHLDVEVYGELRFFERRAEAQLNVQNMRLPGEAGPTVGAIDQLRAEGLFPPVKRQPPASVSRIGIITSRSSRAIGDFETTYQQIGTRAVLAPISWQYVTLEGERASQSIVDGLNALDANLEVDVIVIIRGGGRNVNLAPFDEVEVLRTIIGCSKYVVTGIGHHRDHVLADDVADYVVATPTAAAFYVADLCQAAQGAQAGRDMLAARISRPNLLVIITLLIAALGSLALLAFVLLNSV